MLVRFFTVFFTIPTIISITVLTLSCCTHSQQNSNKGYSNKLLLFTEEEVAIITAHGPWPVTPPIDSSNGIHNNILAQKFGEKLFFDTGLSANGTMACSSCHIPDNFFIDSLPVAQGLVPLERNTPTLLNTAQNIWFGWGGESDSLWSHSIIPLTSKKEMAASAGLIQERIAQLGDYRDIYTELFAAKPSEHSSEQVLVNIAKALAAYQQTLSTQASQFDAFRTALLAGNKKQASTYSLSAQRGLKLFIGKGRCSLCHFGPNFSNGEFADIGVPFFIDNGVDPGRYDGIKQVKASPYNRLSLYSEDTNSGKRTHSVNLQHRNWGEFKVPSLRGIKNTAPYMHNGSLATLTDVINHYSTVSEERLHADGEKIIQALNLSEQETSDLLAFLNTL